MHFAKSALIGECTNYALPCDSAKSALPITALVLLVIACGYGAGFFLCIFTTSFNECFFDVPLFFPAETYWNVEVLVCTKLYYVRCTC